MGLTLPNGLKDTLEKLPAWPNSRIDELLPLTPEWIGKNNVERLGRYAVPLQFQISGIKKPKGFKPWVWF
jgi:hypothetical protein